MTLGFSTHIKGKETYFMEKIWKCFKDLEITKHLQDATFNHGFNWEYFGKAIPKLHTIRKDERDRWKAGNNIHFVIGNRTKNRFQFAPVVKVKSIQNIVIRYEEYLLEDIKTKTIGIKVLVDGVEIHTDMNKMLQLVINDGFETLKDFFTYFDEDFKGKIIHWTDLKY